MFQTILDCFRDVIWIGDNIEHPTSKVHDTKGMLKPAMCCARINQIGRCKLVNMSQPLKRARVQYLSFIAIHADEDMDRVPNFMYVLHRQGIAGGRAESWIEPAHSIQRGC